MREREALATAAAKASALAVSWRRAVHGTVTTCELGPAHFDIGDGDPAGIAGPNGVDHFRMSQRCT